MITSDVSRRGADGDRLEVPGRVERHAQCMVDAGLFQGLKELRERNWQDLPVNASEPRRDRADARAPRSLRLPAARSWRRDSAAACSARRARRISAASCCPTPDACRKKTRRTPTGTASRSTSRRCRSIREIDAFRAVSQLQPCGYDRPMPVADGHRGRVHQRRPPARLVVRAHAHRRPRRSSSAATSDASAGRCCPIRRLSRRRTTCWSNRPTAIACTSRTTTARAWPRSSTTTAQRGGKLIIPAFAIGRVEELIYWLKRLEAEKRIPVLPVFVDSPMAAAALARYTRADARARSRAAAGAAATTTRRTMPPRHDAPDARRRQARQERDVCVFCTERFRVIAQRRGIEAADRVADAVRS